jgi:hypothetical protein
VRRVPRWQTTSLANAIIVFAWLAILRWAPAVVLSPAVAWIAVVLTIVAPIVLWHRGDRAKALALELTEPAT